MSRAPELVDLAEQTFFEDPALDRAFGVVMALATEVYVLRNRQRALERLFDLLRGQAFLLQELPLLGLRAGRHLC